MSGQTAIRIDRLGKRFGAGPLVLDDVNLSIETGEFVCLLGASGCGKSTLLNLIAGLDRPTTGSIDVPAEGAAVMFQESALMPWLTARQNVELALRLRGVARSARRAEALELLDTVNLADAAEKRPHELSGGMRQRVALARALAQDRPRAPHGRAVRRARRHHPRPAPRGARARVAPHRPHHRLRHAQRARGRPARAARRAPLEPPRPRRRRVAHRRDRAAGASSRPRSRRSRSRSPSSSGRRSAEMPHDTTARSTTERRRPPRRRTAIALHATRPATAHDDLRSLEAGLDRLQTSPERAPERLAPLHHERAAAHRLRGRPHRRVAALRRHRAAATRHRARPASTCSTRCSPAGSRAACSSPCSRASSAASSASSSPSSSARPSACCSPR